MILRKCILKINEDWLISTGLIDLQSVNTYLYITQKQAIV